MSGQLIVGIHAVRTALKHGAERIERLEFDAGRRDRRLRQVIDEAKFNAMPDEVFLDWRKKGWLALVYLRGRRR